MILTLKVGFLLRWIICPVSLVAKSQFKLFLDLDQVPRLFLLTNLILNGLPFLSWDMLI